MSSSPIATAPSSAQPRARRPVTEIIENEFRAFDCDSIIVPFQAETARDATFQQEMNELILEATLEMHAWASARPFLETDAATSKYEQQVLELQQQENEQEKTRQRLQEFVTRMRTALALLM
uniref:Uncharacterized protein n=1 Tax=Mycena chlorophos TaxID=658473 RepID=A0ABQ0LFG7_MYCCL|nr:predicted protein [Mycena chlorophos]